MLVFLDFEASSLSRRSFPTEVGRVFEEGTRAGYLIRPAPDWTDWDDRAAAIQRISRSEFAVATPYKEVARVMVEQLAGHDLLASAPSWDGKWLSALLRAAGYPRHTIGLRGSDDALREVAEHILASRVPADGLGDEVADLLALVEVRAPDAPCASRARRRPARARTLVCGARRRARSGLRTFRRCLIARPRPAAIR